MVNQSCADRYACLLAAIGERYANVTVSLRLSKRVEKSTGSGSLKISPFSFFSFPNPISVIRSFVHSITFSMLGFRYQATCTTSLQNHLWQP